MEQIKNNDPIQLKQMILFLKAELDKYEQKVQMYENSFHHSILENLEQQMISMQQEFVEVKDAFGQLEIQLEEYMQTFTQEVHIEMKKISSTYEKHLQLEEKGQLKEAALQKEEIEQLQSEILKLKEERIEVVHANEEQLFVAELLVEVEQQLKDVAAQSAAYEENLKDKLAFIDTLEHKLARISNEIQDIEEI